MNEKAAKLEADIQRLQKEQKDAVDKRLSEQEDWEKLAESRGAELVETRAKADKLDSYEKTLKGVLDAQVGQIPENLRGLVPEAMSTEEQLEWIAKNKQLLMKSQPFDIGAGKGRGSSSTEESIPLTKEQKVAAKKAGVPEVEYAKRIEKK